VPNECKQHDLCTTVVMSFTMSKLMYLQLVPVFFRCPRKSGPLNYPKDREKQQKMYSQGNYTRAPDFAVFTQLHCATCCVAGEKSGGQGRSLRQVPGTYSQTETNSDGNVKQWCADCASEAKHSRNPGQRKRACTERARQQ